MVVDVVLEVVVVVVAAVVVVVALLLEELYPQLETITGTKTNTKVTNTGNHFLNLVM